jgi:DNA protecting protein DprA
VITKSEFPYLIALTQIPRWGNAKINGLLSTIFQKEKVSLKDFFNLSESEWKTDYGLTEKEIFDLQTEKNELPNNAFLVEDMLNQGYEIIPIISPQYSKTLKENLKSTYSPPVLYVKGDKQMLSEKSLAIVGSRDASEISLQFTDNIAKLASKQFKVIVSGFAKGVDKQALDSAIKHIGRSIIVLPQGIMTFSTGFKKYYQQIVEGNVLVLSTFFPKAPWKVELAMARNPIIYGLADEIYVAESNEKGGTWSGVIDGLRKGRKIFVRKPEPDEKNANELLIQKGAVPVDFDGNVLEYEARQLSHQQTLFVSEPREISNPNKNETQNDNSKTNFFS